MNKFKQGLYRFMYGRYGKDSLGSFLLFLSVVIAVVQILFVRSLIGSIILYVFLFAFIFRSYSRNINARKKENQKFLNLTKPIRRRWKARQKNKEDLKHRYFVCPDCSQLVRVPRNKGKVEIICPSCNRHFTRKS